MIENFASEIDRFGHSPIGSRSDWMRGAGHVKRGQTNAHMVNRAKGSRCSSNKC